LDEHMQLTKVLHHVGRRTQTQQKSSIKLYIFIRGWTLNECPHERKAQKR